VVCVQVTPQTIAQGTAVKISKPSIVLRSHVGPYESEKVTLLCQVSEGPSELKYDWYKDSTLLGHHKASIDVTANGKYECEAKNNNDCIKSEEYKLTLKAIPAVSLPKPMLTDLFVTEKITLKCELLGRPEGWIFAWFKGKTKLTESGSQLEIQSAAERDSGDYKCKGVLQNRVETSNTIPTASLPKPMLTDLYVTEKTTLKCELQGRPKGWIFAWFKGETKLPESGSQLEIQSAAERDSGDYKCKGVLQNRITLKCELQGRPEGWIFAWFKGETKLPESGSQLEIQSAAERDSGDYKCKGVLQNRVETSNSASVSINVQERDSGDYKCKGVLRDRVETSNSASVSINVRAIPTASLPKPEWTDLYVTEKITLKCELQGRPEGWIFAWFKGKTKLPESGSQLEIQSAAERDSGDYKCKGVLQNRVETSNSTSVLINVRGDTPQPTIRKRQWFEPFYTGEDISLSCNMTGVGWQYTWFEESDQAKNNRILATGFQMHITSASPKNTGGYLCKATRGNFTVKSQTLQVYVHNLPVAELNLETDLNDIIMGEMTLVCNISDGREWNFTWFENGQKLNMTTAKIKVPGTEQNIKNEFTCQGVRTERPLLSAMSEGFVANNLLYKRKILLAISGSLVCCIVILFIGCVVLKITRKPEKEEPVEDLFFRMSDSTNNVALPLKEYLDDAPTEMEDYKEKEELLTDAISSIQEAVICEMT
ncbi:hypothetical protein DNTS_000369, partial [Danionella cerebrum]